MVAITIAVAVAAVANVHFFLLCGVSYGYVFPYRALLCSLCSLVTFYCFYYF